MASSIVKRHERDEDWSLTSHSKLVVHYQYVEDNQGEDIA
jgi:hypothetical protein